MTDRRDTDPLAELVCFNVYALNRAFSRYYQAAFGETGLTYPKFVILQALDAAGPLSVTELSQRAAVEPNTLSPLLKKMANAGVITRQRSNDDERRMDIAISPLGQEVMKRASAVIGDGFDAFGLDTERVAEAVAYLGKLRDVVDGATAPKLNLDDLVEGS